MFANSNCRMKSIINLLNDQVMANFNSLPPYVPQRERLAKIFILISEGIIKKISYKRRDY